MKNSHIYAAVSDSDTFGRMVTLPDDVLDDFPKTAITIPPNISVVNTGDNPITPVISLIPHLISFFKAFLWCSIIYHLQIAVLLVP